MLKHIYARVCVYIITYIYIYIHTYTCILTIYYMVLFNAKLTNGWLSLNGFASDSCTEVGFPKTQSFN